MFNHLINIITNLGNPKVLLIGDFMLDSYLYGNISKISSEAPVPVLKVKSNETVPGGAGSVAVDLSKLGARVTCFGVVGIDNNATILRRELAKSQIDLTGLIAVSDRPTTLRQRVVGLTQDYHRQQLIRIDDEIVKPFDGMASEFLAKTFNEQFGNCQIICLQDYNKGVISAQLCRRIIDLANKANKLVLVDPAPISDWGKYSGVNLIKPNQNEASKVVGFELHTQEDVEKAASIIQERYEIETVIITLDGGGAYLKENKKDGKHYHAITKEVYDVIGADDMFLAALAICMASGCDYATAVLIANIATGIEVERYGTMPITGGPTYYLNSTGTI